jgi:chromosome segregation ATPase
MFRFSELELHGWDYWPAVKVPLDSSVVILSGPNGSGKTTMLDAIRQLLNGPKLSQKRHVAHYLRRPNQPVLLRAVVSNLADERGHRPFERQQVLTDEATLACALVPDSGVPEKRFTILPGRVPAAELQRLLLEGKDWLAPEQYRRALEYAGISRSLMHILALEQGRADDLANYTPRELFRWIMEARGSQQVLDRYRDARQTYEDSAEEVYRQSQRMSKLQVELNGLERDVRRLDEYLELQQRATKADEIYWATLYQFKVQEHREIGAKLPELRTKATNLLTNVERLKHEQHGLEERLKASRQKMREAESYREDIGTNRDAALRESSQLETQVQRFSEVRRKLGTITSEDVVSLRSSLDEARRRLFAFETEGEAHRAKLSALDASIATLEAGKPIFPPEVQAMLGELAASGIGAHLAADCIDFGAEGWEDAVESALGPLRFALVVAAKDEKRALQIASKHNYPGPLTTTSLPDGAVVGPLSLAKDSPAWMREWTQERRFVERLAGQEPPCIDKSGRRLDRFGAWCGTVKEHFIGNTAIERQLTDLRGERAKTAELLMTSEDHAAQTCTLVRNLEDRLKTQEERLALESELASSEEIEHRLVEARASLQELTRELASAERQATESALYTQRLETDLKTKAADAESTQKELNGLKDKILQDQSRQAKLAPELDGIGKSVTSDLRQQAEQNKLVGTPQQAQAGADATKAALKRFTEEGPIPDESVRAQQQSQIRTIEELKAHIESRQKEADAFRAELDKCRGNYLDVVGAVLSDYARRARGLAEGAQAKLEVSLPHLENDDRSIDEAGIVVRIGFDGKNPIPVGDSSLSGGQKVIAGLIVLMAMAETDRQSFFILDEPFAHLSLDRVDEVGQFLRNSGSQFLITVPTTLDKGQLDPASLLVVLSKKDSKATSAPLPIIARAS